MSKSKKRTSKKSKDSSKCCKKCNFYDCRNKEDPICSLTSESVDEDGICKKFNDIVHIKCDRCKRDVQYTNKEEYYNNVIHFEMKSGSGTSSGQNIHLCRKCEIIAFEKFQELLETIRKGIDDLK